MYDHKITYIASSSSYWHAQSVYSDTVFVDGSSVPLGASFVTLAWSRTSPATTREDRATCTLAIGKTVGGGIYSYLASADKAAAETALDTWWTSMKTDVANQWTLVEYRWHDWLVGETVLGPADRVTARSVAGTFGATNRMPDQDSQTVTFKTASRRHWGRVYLPGIASGRYDTTYGRFVTSQVDDGATFFHTLATNLAASSQEIVVASKAHQGILSCSSIASDDVVDIQRRRRAKQASYHKEYTS